MGTGGFDLLERFSTMLGSVAVRTRKQMLELMDIEKQHAHISHVHQIKEMTEDDSGTHGYAPQATTTKLSPGVTVFVLAVVMVRDVEDVLEDCPR